MASGIARTRPVRPVRPGEILKAELEARAWTQQELADIMDRPLAAVNQIIVGKKQITPETATELARALGNSAEFWLNLEQAYRLASARSEADEPRLRGIEQRRELREAVPCLRELLKRGWVAETDDPAELTRRVLEYFDVPNLAVLRGRGHEARLRQSPAATADPVTVQAWVRRALRQAEGSAVAAYTPARLRAALPELLDQTADVAAVPRVPGLLAEAGVVLVTVPTLPGARIDGAALWLGQQPVVALTLRFDRLDWFWFTLLHELAHLLLGHTGSRIDLDSTAAAELDPYEAEANRAAMEWLIPPDELAGFLATLPARLSRRRVEAFAARIRRHPSIVVGRLHWEQRLPYAQLNGLAAKVAHLLPA